MSWSDQMYENYWVAGNDPDKSDRERDPDEQRDKDFDNKLQEQFFEPIQLNLELED